ncbi:UNVERIFIED_CONTAM: hypothetical protein RMT77_009965 [Armadillidium vulgare]
MPEGIAFHSIWDLWPLSTKYDIYRNKLSSKDYDTKSFLDTLDRKEIHPQGEILTPFQLKNLATLPLNKLVSSIVLDEEELLRFPSLKDSVKATVEDVDDFGPPYADVTSSLLDSTKEKNKFSRENWWNKKGLKRRLVFSDDGKPETNLVFPPERPIYKKRTSSFKRQNLAGKVSKDLNDI